MSTQSVSSRSASARHNALLAAELSARRRVIDTLRLWRDRVRARRELAALTLFDLKDFGYPPTLEAEKQKPFWRA
jgi:uncharacterized protein YjiS (DUF1127 family)